MADIQSAAAEIRRGIKKKKERTNHSMKIYMVSLFHRATIKKDCFRIRIPKKIVPLTKSAFILKINILSLTTTMHKP